MHFRQLHTGTAGLRRRAERVTLQMVGAADGRLVVGWVREVLVSRNNYKHPFRGSGFLGPMSVDSAQSTDSGSTPSFTHDYKPGSHKGSMTP
jgi:hypothetical protein